MNKTLEELEIPISGIRYLKKVAIIDSTNHKFVIKKNNKKTPNIYNYLINRDFTYFPRILTRENSNYEVSEYIDEVKVVDEQKIEDMVYLVGILHQKTMYYKELNQNDIKKIYEATTEQISYLFNYYQDLQNIIEDEIYMEPSDYLLILNISRIYESLSIAKKYLDEWYKLVQTKKTIRYCINHKNLKKEHLIEGNNPYLISWDLAERDLPIIDIYNIFINNYKKINLDTILYLYETKNKLYQHEYLLLIAKLCIIPKIDIKKDIYFKIRDTSNIIIYLEKLTLYLSENNKEETNDNK